MSDGLSPMSPVGRTLIIAGTAAASVAVYFGLPEHVSELARRAAAIFVVAGVFWATTVLPVYATALCIIAMEVLFLAHDGGLAGLIPANAPWLEHGGAPVRLSIGTFFAPFGSTMIVLFMGGFLLAAAIVKHGLDRAIAVRLLAPVLHRPLRLLVGVSWITALLSMWMSNTAAAAVMLSIITPLLPKDGPTRSGTALVLAVAFAANVGGMTTPISTPPNAIAVGLLRSAGYRIAFVDWMLISIPLAAVLVTASALVLYALFRPGAPAGLDERLRARPPMTSGAKRTLAVMLVTVALWVTEPLHGLAPSAVALLAAAALTAMGLLGRRDVDTIDWNVLILMWGGLSLGQAMQTTGLLEHVRELPIAQLGGFWLAAAVALLTVVVGTLMSNTATANLVVPLAMGIGGGEAAMVALVAAYACSFSMALPVSTPPNALAFATGQIRSRDMIVAALIVQTIALVVLLTGYRLVLPWLLRGAGVTAGGQ